MKRPTKIGILHPTFKTLGGAEQHILWLANDLVQQGYAVTILALSFSKKALTKFHSANIETQSLYLPFIPPGDTHRRNIRLMGWRLRPYLKHMAIINVHNFPATLWLASALKEKKPADKTIIWTCHEPSRNLYQHHLDPYHLTLDSENHNTPYTKTPLSTQPPQSLIEQDKTAIQLMDAIITNSAFTQHHIQNIYNQKARVFPFGTHVQISPNHQTTSRTIIIGMVSRLELKKNIPNVLLALHHIRQTNPILFNRLRCHIVGTGSYEQPFKALIKRLELTNIQFEGTLSENELSAFYNRCQFIVFVPFGEPLGFIPIEAAYHKKTTIGSNEGGPLETIQHEITGLLVDPCDPKEIAQAISKLAQDTQLQKQLGENAYNYVSTTYTLKKTTQHYINLFKRLAPKETHSHGTSS